MERLTRIFNEYNITPEAQNELRKLYVEQQEKQKKQNTPEAKAKRLALVAVLKKLWDYLEEFIE